MVEKAVIVFNWKRAFSNSSVNENVCFFGEALKNIFRNFTSNRRIKIVHRKSKWMSRKISAALKKRSKLSEKHYANPSVMNKEQLNACSKYCSEIVIDVKDKFLNRLSVKLDDPNTSAKLSFSIINNFLNNEKIPSIAPILFNSTLISYFKQKAGLFNSYFCLSRQYHFKFFQGFLP